MMIYKHKTQSGFALLIAVVVASIVLAIGLTMLNTAVKQLTLSSVARESEMSFQAASSGLDCARYWRQNNPQSLFTTDSLSGPVAPGVSCFEPSDRLVQSQGVLHTSGPSYTNEFNYQYTWGTSPEERCTEFDMYTMTASTSNYTVDFSISGPGLDITNSVGTNGVKTCDAYTQCTVVIARGYNRACVDLANTSLLNVEREITAEF